MKNKTNRVLALEIIMVVTEYLSEPKVEWDDKLVVGEGKV